MASLIAGPDFEINPAEAFVFGCSALLHDAGMTIAAFPGGIEELHRTDEWQDAASHLKDKFSIKDKRNYDQLPESYIKQANFAALRALHALNAERLLDLQWASSKTGLPQRLLDDDALRTAYSRSIGRIAHSHNWSLEKLLDNLNHAIGPAPEIDGRWSIDEIKIALLLRCADAAHIDRRRAPSFDFALSKPKGVSFDHWTFQNRLNSPTVIGDEIFYASGTDFPVEEASAWWLCFDALKLLNAEISGANAILAELSLSPLLVKKVHGADSPRIMAKRIRPLGWRPVDAEIRVSAPAELAKTLGGKNLYGSGPLAPLRELLQNSVDAIRARRVQEQDPNLGQIKISIDRDQLGQKWLHIEDDGVGMSERVLTGPLLDFGQSFWSSTAVQQEFPGLISKGLSPIGKFGIGFFSVFLLGDHVRVTSKRFDAARSEAKTLEFASLDSRPILKDAENGGNLRNFSTKVSVAIKEETINNDVKFEIEKYYYRKDTPLLDLGETINRGVRQLVSPLDVSVEFTDTTASLNKGFIHKADWVHTPPDIFLGELLSRRGGEDIGEIITAHAPQVRNLIDSDGKHFGRGALDMTHQDRTVRVAGCYISVGGFCSTSDFLQRDSFPLPILGVLNGETDDISRRTAVHNVPAVVIKDWATQQALLIDRNAFSKYNLMRACARILHLGGDPGPLPFCFFGGRFLTFNEFRDSALTASKIIIPARRTYSHNFNVTGINGAPSTLFFEKPIENVALFEIEDVDDVLDKLHAAEAENSSVIIMDKSEIEKLVNRPLAHLGFAANILQEIWGKPARFSFSKLELLSSDYKLGSGLRWVLNIERAELN